MSIDSAGGVIVAGAPGGATDGTALLISRGGDGGWLTSRLPAPSNAGGVPLRFGAFVKVSSAGRTVAVGAPNPSGAQMGVRVFRNGDGGTTFHDVSASNEGFGAAFDLDATGNLLVVGAQNSSSYGPPGTGLVRSYLFNGATYLQINQNNPQSPDAGIQDHLLPPERPVATYFGSSIAVSNAGTALWVGSYGLPSQGGSAVGGVLRFSGAAAGWYTASPQLRFQRRSATIPENCADVTGLAVSEAGDLALIGCPGEEGPMGFQAAGGARLLQLDGGTITSQVIVTPNEWPSFGSFARVALTRSGSIGVIGQPGRSAAWLLDPADAGLTDLNLGITLPVVLTGASKAGTSVAISDDGRTIVVGAPELAAVCTGAPSVFGSMGCVTSGTPSGGVLIFER